MELVWTKRAQKKFSEILDHIEDEFGSVARQSFRSKTRDFTALLVQFPEMGPLEIMNKNLFYRIKKDRVIILTFFDSRQDPKKRPR